MNTTIVNKKKLQHKVHDGVFRNKLAVLHILS